MDEIRKRALWNRNTWLWSPDASLGLEHSAWGRPSNKVRRNALGQLVALTVAQRAHWKQFRSLLALRSLIPIWRHSQKSWVSVHTPAIGNRICLCADYTLNWRRETPGSVQTFNEVRLSCFCFMVEKQIYFLIQVFPPRTHDLGLGGILTSLTQRSLEFQGHLLKLCAKATRKGLYGQVMRRLFLKQMPTGTDGSMYSCWGSDDRIHLPVTWPGGLL